MRLSDRVETALDSGGHGATALFQSGGSSGSLLIGCAPLIFVPGVGPASGDVVTDVSLGCR